MSGSINMYMSALVQFGDEISQLDQYAELYMNSHEVQAALTRVYEDILEFLRRMMKLIGMKEEN
jgi:CII-binding regulator of phage lambda lysogenization HflD